MKLFIRKKHEFSTVLSINVTLCTDITFFGEEGMGRECVNDLSHIIFYV